MIKSVPDVIDRFRREGYICDPRIATTVFLATRMQKPILAEGPAGVGKTELAKVLAGSLNHELIRLQCYEGLDESKALYEWEYAKQLLYTQILKDKISDTLQSATSLRKALEKIEKEEDVFFSRRFILPRPLLKSIVSDQPTVLLIDEVDRADQEFEAFLLEILSDFQISIPEIGTLKAKHIPLVVLTSNASRELSDALKRRCLFLYLDFPSREREIEIVRLKIPGISESLAGEIVQLVQGLRQLDLKKRPSIGEVLDWARALLILNADRLEPNLVNETLNLILKYEGDIQKARGEIQNFLPEPEKTGSKQVH
ncbi:MAG: MoxR family ATPase [Deltaproteobacteria bacterium]|nr:MoxR family ATPase [Deltaproteobacteria bacterium]